MVICQNNLAFGSLYFWGCFVELNLSPAIKVKDHFAVSFQNEMKKSSRIWDLKY